MIKNLSNLKDNVIQEHCCLDQSFHFVNGFIMLISDVLENNFFSTVHNAVYFAVSVMTQQKR